MKLPRRCVGRGQDLVAVRRGRRHRLLQKDMLAAAQRVDRDVAMVVDVRGDADHVDLRVGQQVVVVGVAPGDLEAVGHFGQPLRAPRAQGRQFDAGHASDSTSACTSPNHPRPMMPQRMLCHGFWLLLAAKICFILAAVSRARSRSGSTMLGSRQNGSISAVIGPL